MIRGADDVDQRADIYSFGILLYLMLCGQLPFVADDVTQILQMQLAQRPVPPRELNAELSPELAAIIERCLAKQRDDRYPSMAALLRDFEAALPAGADRELIAAQLGTAADAPFASALAFHEPRAHRPSQPALVEPSREADLTQAQRPPAPRGRKPMLAIGGALALVVIGVIAAQRITAGSRATPGELAPAVVAAAAPARAPALIAPPSTVELAQPPAGGPKHPAAIAARDVPAPTPAPTPA
ncbi:MAG TPA: protein kinase, partial [Kofleriaceae bacterium]